MRAISLFTGIGGLDYGFELAGIETVLQVDNDPWCRAVLQRHWPRVARLDDVRQVDAATFSRRRGNLVGVGSGANAERLGGAARGATGTDAIDLVSGGFPCQDVSVAGKRAGFRGERSSLWFEFERVLSELRPRWVVIENVPGLLSSNDGGDMATVLGGLGDLGFGWAYRVLDARWFGVPQRRRRIFIVACAGDQRRAASVLAVCESCGGYPAARREAGQRVAAPAAAGARGAGAGRHLSDVDPAGVARPLVARESGYRLDLESENFLVANALEASDGHHGYSSPRGDGNDNLIAVGGVRRLTPLECERLQGFPDGWTGLLVDGKPIADAHRYRMLGNAVATVVAQWLGHRLVEVNSWS